MLDALKKNGANVPISTAGLSSAGHNFMESVKSAGKIEYKHVTYDGGNPAVLAAVSGETQAVAQLLVEMTEMIKGKRLVPLAVLSDKPIMLEGFGEIAPTTKWLPTMPAPMNYFGIWVAKGAPDNVVKTMGEVWEKKIKNSEALKKYAAARSALFAPLHGDEAETEVLQDGALLGLALFRCRQGQGLARHAGHPAPIGVAATQLAASGWLAAAWSAAIAERHRHG